MSEVSAGATVGVMQPYIFPYAGYFSLAAAVDTFVFLDDVQMIKRGWVNRNQILIHGEAHRFTIPLLGSSQTKNISDIQIAEDFSSFVKMLSNAYAKAPYKDHALELITEIITFDKANLANFAANSVKQVCDYIGLKTRFLFSSDVPQEAEASGPRKILGIVKSMSADKYINPIGGVDIYDSPSFAAEGVDIRFVRSNLPPYKQNSREFVSGLSIIDLMMFLSPDDILENVSDYELLEI